MNEPPFEQQKRSYRAFRIGAKGRIDGFEIIEAESEQEATAIAKQLVNGHAVELWDRGQMIGRFESERPLS